MLPPLGVTPRFEDLEYYPPYAEERLQRWRTVGDPLADEIVAELATEAPLKNIHDLLGTVRARAAAGDARCLALLAACESLPAWADFSAMRSGQRLIASFAPFLGISLFSGSLVGGGMFYKAAKVVQMTGMLSGNPLQRLTETVAMVARMPFPGQIEPGGKAHEVFMRVRLLHAGIRRFLVDSGRFRHPTEVPINQQDLAITLGEFCYLSIRGLHQLGIRLSREQIDSFVLLWRWAGHVLGIDEELLPTTAEEQQAFFLASCKHQARPDKLTVQHTQLLDDVARQVPAWLFPVAQTFLHQMTRYLSGNDYVTGMRIEDLGDYWGIRLARGLGRTVSFIHDHVPGGEPLLYRMGARRFAQSLAANERRRAYGYRVQTHDKAAAAAA